MSERRQYLTDKIEETTNIILHTMKAQELLMSSCCREHIRTAINAIPDNIFRKIINVILQFNRHDITRQELNQELERQIKLRKRALRRYVKLYDKEFGDVDET